MSTNDVFDAALACAVVWLVLDCLRGDRGLEARVPKLEENQRR